MSLLRVDRLHTQALEISSRYRRVEAELVDVLIKVEGQRVFLVRGHASLFAYVTSELGVSENAAYSLITVARKVREVPELGVKFRNGEITLSKARRVAAVLTVANQDEWLARACVLSTRQLEREIARVRPETTTTEEASYVGGDRIQLKVGLSESQMLELRHAQDLLCQSRRRAVTLEETIGVMTEEFLRRKDPVERARRQTVRKGLLSARVGGLVTPANGHEVAIVQSPSSQVGGLVTVFKRRAIPAEIQHAVNLRDQRGCVQISPDGSRCNQRRWVDIHHRQPVSEGGSHSLDNLVTLCSAHHKFHHLPAGKGVG